MKIGYFLLHYCHIYYYILELQLLHCSHDLEPDASRLKAFYTPASTIKNVIRFTLNTLNQKLKMRLGETWPVRQNAQFEALLHQLAPRTLRTLPGFDVTASRIILIVLI